MPKEQLTEIEYYRCHETELQKLFLVEKAAKIEEMRKNANIVLQVTAQEMKHLEQERQSIKSKRTMLFMEIGDRIGATGKPSSWKVRLDHKTPAESTMIWEEKQD